MRNRNAWSVPGISLLIVASLTLAGCGGGGGGGNGGGAGNTVSLTLTGAEWVAFQDGKEGTWQTLSSTSGSVPVNDAAGRYSVAWVCPGDKTTVYVVHTTRAETPSLSATCGPATPPAEVNVSVNVSGLNGGSALTGIGEVPFVNSQTKPVPAGSYDVISVRSSGGVPNRLWFHPNQSFTQDRTYTVDFSASDETLRRVVDITAGTATVSSADMTEQVAGQFFYVSGTRSTLIGVGTIVGNGTLMRYPIFPSGVAPAGTLFRLNAIGTDRGVVLVQASFGNSVDLTLPPPYTAASFTSSSTGAVTVTVAGLDYAETPRAYILRLSQGNLRWSVLFTRAWLGTDTTYTTPDLTSLSGWNNSWSLARSTQVDGECTVLVSTAPASVILDYFAGRPISASGQVRFAVRSQSFVP